MYLISSFSSYKTKFSSYSSRLTGLVWPFSLNSNLTGYSVNFNSLSSSNSPFKPGWLVLFR